MSEVGDGTIDSKDRSTTVGEEKAGKWTLVL